MPVSGFHRKSAAVCHPVEVRLIFAQRYPIRVILHGVIAVTVLHYDSA